MISFGGFFSCSRASTSLSVVALKTMHFLSSNSRIVCTCGRIRRPLGAWMSWGITRRTTSPSDTRSPAIVRLPLSLVVSVSGFVLLLCGVVDILQEILVRQVFRDFAIRLGRCSSRSVADVKSFAGFLWCVADACRVIARTAAVEAYSDDEGSQGSNAADCCQHHLIPLVVELGVAVHLYYCDGVVVVVSALGESQSVHFARYASHHICCLSLGGEEFQQLLVRHASPHAISAEDEPVALAIALLFDIGVVRAIIITLLSLISVYIRVRLHRG